MKVQKGSLLTLCFSLALFIALVESVLLPLNKTSNNKIVNARPTCTGRSDWTVSSKGPTPPDCATLLMKIAEATKSFKLNALEFVEAPNRLGQDMLTIVTPRKWTWGTCSLAVVMMTSDIDFPGRPRLQYQDTDIARSEDISMAGNAILNTCVRGRILSGWKATGLGGSIGVSLLTSGSEVAQRIHNAGRGYLSISNSSSVSSGRRNSNKIAP